MLNLITNALPETVFVGDVEIPIETGFRASIQAQILLESDLEKTDLFWGVFTTYYGSTQAFDDAFLAAHTEALIEKAMSFARMDDFAELTKAPKGSRKRTFDWDVDQKALVADFQREYGLDLTDAKCEMHWWRFLALFEGLSDKSATMTAIGYRALDIPKKLPAEEKKRLQKLKRLYELPPRTKDEALARDAAIWGD